MSTLKLTKLTTSTLLAAGFLACGGVDAEAAHIPPHPPIADIVSACPAGGYCVVPPGNYSGPLVVNSESHIVMYGVTLHMPAGRDAVVLNRTAERTTIEGGLIRATGTSSVVGQGAGIRQFAPRVHLSNLVIYGFGRGWVCNTSDSMANCNGSMATRVSVYQSDLDGVYFDGPDSNAITTTGLDIKAACWRARAGDDCAGLHDSGFLSNTHIGLIVHSVQNGGDKLAPRLRWPSWKTVGRNAKPTIIGPYCEWSDTAPAEPEFYTTIVGGNCAIAPGKGWTIRPGVPLTTPVMTGGGGPFVLGTGAPGSVRVGSGAKPPIYTTESDKWVPGDLFILNRVPKLTGECKISQVVTVEGNVVKTACVTPAIGATATP